MLRHPQATLKYVNHAGKEGVHFASCSVKDRRFIATIAAISVALVGLVIIQVKWINDTVRLRDAQFDQSVDNALIAVSDRLERMEKWRGLESHEEGRRLLGQLRGEEAEEEEYFIELQDSLHTMERILLEDEHLTDPEREALITDMVRGIVGAEHRMDIRSRLDPQVLDSLLSAELRDRGIFEAHEQAVIGPDGEVVMAYPVESKNNEALLNATHRSRLFRNDLDGGAYQLHVIVPGRQRHLLRSLWPMLLLSLVFVLMIVFAFVFTFRTIFRQKRISEIKNDLVNNLTHELKTPISTIALACEALADPSIPHTEQQMRSYVGMIRDENKRLGVLVENVLQSAVLDSGAMRLRPVELDMHALLRDVVRNTEVQLQRRNGSIQLDLAAEVYHIQGDRIHLTNVIHNLLDNAVKYADKQPLIHVSTASSPTMLSIRITDNGIGIPRSEQKKIFDRLYRVPTGNVHNVKGFGLGLSYVLTVVQQHQGTIEVDSEPGKGSTFHIQLPI